MKNRTVDILYDHQIFSLQKVGGISRYYSELVKNLPQHGCQGILPEMYSENLYLNKKNPAPLTSKIHPKIQSRVNEFLSRGNAKELLAKGQYDIFHPTYYSTYHLGKTKKPVVITVYDMIHEIFPEQFLDPYTVARGKKKLISAADKVITISHHTKEDILRFVKVDPDKIEVVHLATSIKEIVPAKCELHFRKYVLFVGQRKGYKNFDLLLRSFSKIKDKYPYVHLFCVGGGGFSPEEMKLIADLKLDDRIFQKGVSDSELAWVYQNAECFVFPSSYEGFGIPILEAMTFGTPTVLSEMSCFPEIAQEAALYFKNEESLSEVLSYVLGNKQEMLQYKEAGIIQATKYSWDKVAGDTVSVYRKLL